MNRRIVIAAGSVVAVAALAVLGFFIATAGTSSSPTPAPAAAAVQMPNPDAGFLQAAHAGQWPESDARLVTLAKSHCASVKSGVRTLAESQAMQEQLLQVGVMTFTSAQASAFVTESERAYCPEVTP